MIFPSLREPLFSSCSGTRSYQVECTSFYISGLGSPPFKFWVHVALPTRRVSTRSSSYTTSPRIDLPSETPHLTCSPPIWGLYVTSIQVASTLLTTFPVYYFRLVFQFSIVIHTLTKFSFNPLCAFLRTWLVFSRAPTPLLFCVKVPLRLIPSLKYLDFPRLAYLGHSSPFPFRYFHIHTSISSYFILRRSPTLRLRLFVF